MPPIGWSSKRSPVGQLVEAEGDPEAGDDGDERDRRAAQPDCARALLRSALWDSDTWPDRSALPTLGQILSDQIQSVEISADALDAGLEQVNRDLD